MNLLPPTLAPLTEVDARPPRPGWAKALGIAHIVVATLSSVLMILSAFWVLIASTSKSTTGAPSAMMGMDDPRYLWFAVTDGVTGLIANGFTFASGLALINLRMWGARVWEWLAPVKIVRVVILWGGFIVLVVPTLAGAAGAAVVKMMQSSMAGSAGRKFPTAAEMTLIYSWMFLAMGIGMIVLGSIYPAFTWWAVRRRGLRAALVEGGLAPASSSLSTRSDGGLTEEARLP